ncbi:hypothetical protein [uncultured Cetobacterium sp.]|uniref:hypothetical protein n=1 Tax=uncultured Cetobacterium sp. TaxID=527638 RepID=UPI00261DDF33|nr:hypothetical protein [uncultured Cetobacterium sp.]
MDLKDIFSAIGSLAFICAILAVAMFIINYKFKDLVNTISQGKFNHLKFHKFLGISTVILATVHGLGMIYISTKTLTYLKGQSGFFTLIIFWIIGTIPFLNKKIPIKYKRSFFKLHKILGILVFIFILIHVSL